MGSHLAIQLPHRNGKASKPRDSVRWCGLGVMDAGAVFFGAVDPLRQGLGVLPPRFRTTPLLRYARAMSLNGKEQATRGGFPPTNSTTPEGLQFQRPFHGMIQLAPKLF